MTKISIIYTTFPTREKALFSARGLLEARLVACANVAPAGDSLYRWEGRIQEEPEVAVILKTGQDKLAAAMEALRQSHPYENPCIVVLPVTDGAPAFLQWVIDETR